MSKNKNEITVVQEGGLILIGGCEQVRMGFLTMAKNALLIFADNIGSLECGGYLENQEAIKAATQKLYDELMKEFAFKVKMTDRTGRFVLIPRESKKATALKMAGAA